MTTVMNVSSTPFSLPLSLLSPSLPLSLSPPPSLPLSHPLSLSLPHSLYIPTADDGEMLATIPKVRVVRMEERSGLMRARVKGAELAQGPILTFLDSHCEVTTGWLQPLLSRIKTVSNSLNHIYKCPE